MIANTKQNRKQNIFHADRVISQRGKKSGIEHRGPSLDLRQRSRAVAFSGGPIHHRQRDRKAYLVIERAVSREESFRQKRPAGAVSHPRMPKNGFGRVLSRRIGRVQAWSLTLHSIDRNPAKVSCDLLDKIFVERLTQNHAQGFRLRRRHGCGAQVERAVVAHNVAEVTGDKRWRIEATAPSGPEQ